MSAIETNNMEISTLSSSSSSLAQVIFDWVTKQQNLVLTYIQTNFTWLRIGSRTEVKKNVDLISEVPDDILVMIISRLSIEEAVRTSTVSKRWEHMWKQISHLVFEKPRVDNRWSRVGTLITNVLNNHRGRLESCVINYSSYQGTNGMLNTWIQSLTCEKHTKVITLIRHFDRIGKVFDFEPNLFSHPTLMSLTLRAYTFTSSLPFRNCSNLKTLKLLSIGASNVTVFNEILSSCPSLEVLVLHICVENDIGGPLKIMNNEKLKLLHVLYMFDIGGLQVSSTSLDILVLEHINTKNKDFVRHSPHLPFNSNLWRCSPHLSYNISKEGENIVHEELMNIISDGLVFNVIGLVTASVSIDLMNRIEVERLRQILHLKIRRIIRLEIIFKNNNNAHREVNESWYKNFWNNKDPFPNAKFSVKTLLINNFSGSEEEFAFASCLIKQGTNIDKIMIKTTSFPAKKKLEIEAVVAKLRALQTEERWEPIIECF